MQQVDVYVDATQSRGFRRRAIAAFKRGKEYMEAVFIKRGVGEFHVVSFHKLILTKQGEGIVECEDTHYLALRNEAKAQGLEFGTIHSHVYGDSSPSVWDHEDSVKDGDALCGVCFVWKDDKTKRIRSRIDFWQPQLPAKLHLISSK
jgi:hypothetical protein